MPLILSDNIIWPAYRFIAENKIFRLGVSLLYFYMFRRNGLAKKNDTKRYNILLQMPRIFRHIHNK